MNLKHFAEPSTSIKRVSRATQLQNKSRFNTQILQILLPLSKDEEMPRSHVMSSELALGNL